MQKQTVWSRLRPGAAFCFSFSFFFFSESYHHLSVDRLKGTYLAHRKLMGWVGQVYRKALGCGVREWESVKHLCPWPDQVIRRLACFAVLLIVFDFKKHLKKIRPTSSEIQQPKSNIGLGDGSWECTFQTGRRERERGYIAASHQSNKILTSQLNSRTNWTNVHYQSNPFYVIKLLIVWWLDNTN